MVVELSTGVLSLADTEATSLLVTEIELVVDSVDSELVVGSGVSDDDSVTGLTSTGEVVFAGIVVFDPPGGPPGMVEL